MGGPLPAKRRLLMEAGNSIMLYRSDIWAEKLNSKKGGKHTYIGAECITSSYRTMYNFC